MSTGNVFRLIGSDGDFGRQVMHFKECRRLRTFSNDTFRNWGVPHFDAKSRAWVRGYTKALEGFEELLETRRQERGKKRSIYAHSHACALETFVALYWVLPHDLIGVIAFWAIGLDSLP